jgi:PAS domain S-box-containing protein
MYTKVLNFLYKYVEVFVALIALFFLYLTSFYSYLLFHSLSEMVAVVTAFGIFIVIWNTRKFWDSNYLLLVGIAYFFVALIQVLHLLAFKGMGVFLENFANTPTQLWVAGRYITSITFVIAPLLLGRKLLRPGFTFGIYLFVTTAVIISIFFLEIFPVAYIDSIGQTPFKIYSEYFISFLFFVAMILLYQKRKEFDFKIYYLLQISLALNIAGEFVFTFYLNVSDTTNLIGHILLVLSYYFIYLAFIENTIQHPFRSVFKNLKDREVALRESEERYRSIVELSPDAVWVHVNGEIVYTNTMGAVLLDAADKSAVLGKNIMDLIEPEYRNVVAERVKKMTEGDILPRLNDLKIRRFNNSIVEVEVASRRILYQGQVAIQSIFHDIGERKHVEEMLRDAADFSEGVVETIWEPLIVVDSRLRVRFVNKSFCSFFLVDQSSIISKNLTEIEGGEWNIPELVAMLKRAIDSDKKFYKFEMQRTFLKVGMKIVRVSIGKIKKTSMLKPLILISIEDVTEEKMMETRILNYAEQMKQEKAHEKALLSSLGVGIVSIDATGKILYVNKAFEDITKLDSKDLHTKKFTDVVPLFNSNDERVPSGETPIEQALSTGRKVIVGNIGFAPFFMNKKSEKIAVAITASPVIFEDTIRGVIAIFREVTKEREVDRAKTEFISLASHQLRTPLAGISLSSELLLKGVAGSVTGEQKEYLEEIYESTKRMSTLVGTLLNISRIEMGTIVLRAEPLNPVHEIESVVNDLKTQAVSKNLNIKKDYDASIHRITFDKNAFRIMTENLISNAIRYTPENGNITISLQADGKEMILKVADTGCGIREAEQDKVFSRLFRAENAKEVSVEGVGLGLYMTKLLADRTNSKIWFESKENKGTTFSISITAASTR